MVNLVGAGAFDNHLYKTSIMLKKDQDRKGVNIKITRLEKAIILSIVFIIAMIILGTSIFFYTIEKRGEINQVLINTNKDIKRIIREIKAD